MATTNNGPCPNCNGSGTIETGNNDLPCPCPAGDAALFNFAGVRGSVTGKEMRKHFLNGAPQPIILGRGGMDADQLPGRINQ